MKSSASELGLTVCACLQNDGRLLARFQRLFALDVYRATEISSLYLIAQ